MAKLRTVFICSNCGYETGKWLGKCPSCNRFNTFEEDVKEEVKAAVKAAPVNIVSLSDVSADYTEKRISTQISELDRVLNGGIVEGSLTLLGGDPGIGKSTLLLHLCENLGRQDKRILYVSGEESVNQIKMRANRLNVMSDRVMLMAETDLSLIESAIKAASPDIVFVDSIQTVYNNDISSSPGSVTQVRECTSAFMRLAKGKQISIIIVGHVTKEGTIAGPKVLEHMVDTVLYFEGERHASYRIIRTVKNRFGPVHEIGVFEMQDTGLKEILNPSEYMLSGRPLNSAGSVVTASAEGTRPILTEVQALVSYTNFGMPRRSANGMDYNRVVMLMAVLEKRMGFSLGSYDSYINIAGGLKVMEPAVDLAVIAAITGSYKNIPVNYKTLVFGEVGLTGEIRAVTMSDKRVAEAAKLGFEQCIIPQANLKWMKETKNMHVYGVSNISELMELIF